MSTVSKTFKNNNDMVLTAKIGYQYYLNTGSTGSSYSEYKFNPNEERTISIETPDIASAIKIDLDAYWISSVNKLKLCRADQKYSSTIKSISITAPTYTSGAFDRTYVKIVAKNTSAVALKLRLAFEASLNTDDTLGANSYAYTVEVGASASKTIDVYAKDFNTKEGILPADIEFTSFKLKDIDLITTETLEILATTNVDTSISDYKDFVYTHAGHSMTSSSAQLKISNNCPGKLATKISYGYSTNKNPALQSGSISSVSTPNATDTFNISAPTGEEFIYFNCLIPEYMNIQQDFQLATMKSGDGSNYGVWRNLDLVNMTLESRSINKSRKTVTYTFKNPNAVSLDLIYTSYRSELTSSFTTTEYTVVDSSARVTIAANSTKSITLSTSETNRILNKTKLVWGAGYVGGSGLGTWVTTEDTLVSLNAGTPTVTYTASITAQDVIANTYTAALKTTITSNGTTEYTYNNWADVLTGTTSSWSDISHQKTNSYSYTDMLQHSEYFFGTMTLTGNTLSTLFIQQEYTKAPSTTYLAKIDSFSSSNDLTTTIVSISANTSSSGTPAVGTVFTYYYSYKRNSVESETFSKTVTATSSNPTASTSITIPIQSISTSGYVSGQIFYLRCIDSNGYFSSISSKSVSYDATLRTTLQISRDSHIIGVNVGGTSYTDSSFTTTISSVGSRSITATPYCQNSYIAVPTEKVFALDTSTHNTTQTFSFTSSYVPPKSINIVSSSIGGSYLSYYTITYTDTNGDICTEKLFANSSTLIYVLSTTTVTISATITGSNSYVWPSVDYVVPTSFNSGSTWNLIPISKESCERYDVTEYPDSDPYGLIYINDDLSTELSNIGIDDYRFEMYMVISAYDRGIGDSWDWEGWDGGTSNSCRWDMPVYEDCDTEVELVEARICSQAGNAVEYRIPVYTVINIDFPSS